MKKKMYRVKLFPHETQTARDIIYLAAKHNADCKMIKDIYQLRDLGAVAANMQNPKEELNFEIIGETKLCLDVKFNGEWHPSCEIEEIEVFEAIAVNEEEEELNPIYPHSEK